MYDYLIVGSGLYGSICAYELNKKGYKVLVVEKREHIGGNIYTQNIKILKVLMFINMVLIFSILLIKKFGNILINLLNLITILIHQLRDIKMNSITCLLT